MNLNLTTTAEIQSIANALQSIITAMAIIAGGIWAYTLYYRRREQYPRAEIKHEIYWQKIPNKGIILSVDVIIHNLSEVLLKGLVLDLKINRMLPEGEQLISALNTFEGNTFEEHTYGLKFIDWPELVSDYVELAEIEPNEFQPRHFDFLIPSDVESISMNSRFTKTTGKKKSKGWSLTTIHNLKNEAGR